MVRNQARIQEFLVGGDDMDEEKSRQGSGGRRRPPAGVQGQSPWWGLRGAKPPTKATLFSRIIQ
jgi:hypothetical protein